MIVLGFHHGGIGDVETPVGHDASAAIVVDRRIVAAVEEERFSRVKHTSRFPAQAIAYCLKEAGAGLADVDLFCFPWSPDLDRRNMARAGVELAQILQRHSLRQRIHADLFEDFAGDFGFSVPRERRRCLPHHLCHAASAFYCSPFEQAAYLIIDAYGEMVSVSYGTADDGALRQLDEVLLPTTLGGLYQSYTRLLGFHGRDDEYKVMGLAAFGSSRRFSPLFRDQWRPTEDGIAQVNDRTARTAVGELCRFRRWPGEPLTKDHEDIAAALQETLEEQVLHLATVVRRRTGRDHLCLAGGVALNSTANGKLARAGLFRDVFIQPAASDAGVALGAALLVSSRRARGQAAPRPKERFSVYLGPAYSEAEIEEACSAARCEITVTHADDVVEATVQRLLRQQVVGWFQGRLEFGPRALGNRSILADPRHEEMRERVNRAVKHREPFRPFAPAITAEAAERYFALGPQREFPFMIMTLPVHEARRGEIAAVVHRDHTARVQTVTREQHPLFWRLLSRFGELTGVPALLNTSFNVNGEPIVCSPGDAIECFLSTDLDALVLGRRMVERRRLETELLLKARPRIQSGLGLESSLDPPVSGPGLEWRGTSVARRHFRAQLSEPETALLLAFDGSRTLGEVVEALYGPFRGDEERAETCESAAELLRSFLRQRFVHLSTDGDSDARSVVS